MRLFRTSGWTCVAGHTASRSSSCVTSRPACSTRYCRTANALGVSRMRSSSAVSRATPETLIDSIQPEWRELLHDCPYNVGMAAAADGQEGDMPLARFPLQVYTRTVRYEEERHDSHRHLYLRRSAQH